MKIIENNSMLDGMKTGNKAVDEYLKNVQNQIMDEDTSDYDGPDTPAIGLITRKTGKSKK